MIFDQEVWVFTSNRGLQIISSVYQVEYVWVCGDSGKFLDWFNNVHPVENAVVFNHILISGSMHLLLAVLASHSLIFLRSCDILEVLGACTHSLLWPQYLHSRFSQILLGR